MNKLLGLAMVASMFAVSACGGMPGTGGGDEGGNGGGGFDMAQYMIDQYKSGAQKAPYWVVVHADVEAGHHAEWTTTSVAAGTETKSTMATLACKKEGNNVWVEQDMGMGYIMCSQVDLSKTEGANVVKAWIGKKGEKAEEIQVMEYVKPEGTAGEAPKYETGEETIEAAGKNWDCTWMSNKDENVEWKNWTAKQGWFGGLVKNWSKHAAGESTMVLTKVATDGQSWLKWE